MEVDVVFSAVAKDDVAGVERLLLVEPSLVNARKEFVGTPLHEARSAAMVRLLLRLGAEIDSLGWLGATPLHEAADRGNTEVVQELFNSGASVQARSEAGFLPLHRAATGEIVWRLLSADAAELETRDSHGRTPLHFAAQFGRESAVEALLDVGAEVDARTGWGQTPLYLAAQDGHLGVVRLLLSAGAGVNAMDSAFGQTPLHTSAFRGQTPVVMALLEAGADTSLRNHTGQLPYHCARDNRHSGVASLLLDQTAIGALGLTQQPQTDPLPGRHRCLRVHPSGQLAVTLVANGRVALWSLEGTPRIRYWIQTTSALLYGAAVHPAGGLLAIGGDAPMIGEEEFARDRPAEQFLQSTLTRLVEADSQGPAGFFAPKVFCQHLSVSVFLHRRNCFQVKAPTFLVPTQSGHSH